MALDFEADWGNRYCKQTLPAVIKSASVTLAAWIKAESNVAATVVIGMPREAERWGKGVGLFYIQGKIRGRMGGGDGVGWKYSIGTTVLSLGTWYHIATTYDDTTKDLKAFLNGVEDASINCPGVSIDWTDGGGGYPFPAQLYFAARKTNALGPGATIPDSLFFDGVMDEVCIYDAALTEAQIQSMLYRRQPWHSNLVGYWRMDEGAGDVLVDLVNGNNAARAGAVWDNYGAPLTYG